jgi:hypothetical protein
MCHCIACGNSGGAIAQETMMKNQRFLMIASVICLFGICLSGCAHDSSPTTYTEKDRALFGTYGARMTPDIAAKMQAAMAAGYKKERDEAQAKAPSRQ